MEINGHFIDAVKLKPSIDVSRRPDGFIVRVNGQAIQPERPEDMCSFTPRLAKLLKKPIFKN